MAYFGGSEYFYEGIKKGKQRIRDISSQPFTATKTLEQEFKLEEDKLDKINSEKLRTVKTQLGTYELSWKTVGIIQLMVKRLLHHYKLTL